MEASSRESLAEARERLAERTRGATGLVERTRERLTGQQRGASADELLRLADELFAVSRVLDEQPALRRALSDPAGKPADRAGLARRLFGSKVSDAALDMVETVARLRWSRPFDLVEATSALAVEASLDAAEARGELEGVEDELFRFGRIVAGDPDLGRILGDRTAPAAGKSTLIDRLLSGRVSAVTEQLVRNVLTARYAASPEIEIERLTDAASRRRGQSIARVTSAVELTPTQEQRLAAVLGRLYGRPVGLQVTVDPSVLGGLVVQVGDEVIDGSIANRLEAAERRLAG
jgi:F-type H+-transporting ATPase subunit delta